MTFGTGEVLGTVMRAGVLGLGLSAAGVTDAAAETLRIAVPSDPGYLDPAYWGSTVDQYLIDNLFPRLAKPVPGESWKVELDAAASVDRSDPMAIEFELKPGIMWTNGYGELTAEDVEFSFERHLDPALESGVAVEYSSVEDVEVTGRYTGIIHLNEPSATLWPTTLTFTSGAILPKAAVTEAGGWFDAIPLATAGAYRIKDFEPGNRLVLERNPEWTGETGDFDEIELLPISDPNTAELAFAAGEIDYLVSSASNYDTLKASPLPHSVIKLVPSLDPVFLGITMTNEKLSDIRVRRAIQLALDVPTIVQAASGGHATQATGLISEGLPGHRDEVTLHRDLEKARALLDEAGAEGLSVRLDYINTTERDTAAQIMQANLAEAGIMLELNGQDEGTFWSVDEARAADLELHMKTWAGNLEGIYTLQYFVEEQAGYWNWEGFSDLAYDALLDKVRVTADPDERGEIYKQMQTMLEESGAFVFLSHDPFVVIHRDSVIPGSLPDGRPVFSAFRSAD